MKTRAKERASESQPRVLAPWRARDVDADSQTHHRDVTLSLRRGVRLLRVRYRCDRASTLSCRQVVWAAVSFTSYCGAMPAGGEKYVVFTRLTRRRATRRGATQSGAFAHDALISPFLFSVLALKRIDTSSRRRRRARAKDERRTAVFNWSNTS